MELKITRLSKGNYIVNGMKIFAFDVQSALQEYLSVHDAGSNLAKG